MHSSAFYCVFGTSSRHPLNLGELIILPYDFSIMLSHIYSSHVHFLELNLLSTFAGS